MTAYMITEVSNITDPDAMAAYRQGAGPLIQQYGGTFLARAEPCSKLEGEWSRVAVVSFPDIDTAERFYHSPEYKALKERRAQAATVRIIVLESME